MNPSQNLKNVLADTYALMIKTHVYHWNVVGPYFKQYHDFFGSQYEELFQAADRIAERIRALGDYAPGGLRTFERLTSMKDPEEQITDHEMLIDLLSDHRKLTTLARQGIQLAVQFKDDATANMLTDRVEEHEKQIWMIQSLLNSAEGVKSNDAKQAKAGYGR